MAKKKKKPEMATSQADTAQARDILERYHQAASLLRKTASHKQAEEALGEINELPEAAQVALAKALAREQHTDAADLLVAINELSSQKNARKEAKRSLIQLEGQRIYPNWKPPIEERSLSTVTTSTPLRRFWKGLVSDTMDAGRVQLALAWEQGTGYRRVLAFIFALDFISGGVEGFVMMQDERKDDFEATAASVAKSLGSPFLDCSLARGRSLLKKALEINEQSGTKLPPEYRHNLPLIKQLVLEAPGLEDEDVDLDFLDEDELDEGPDLSGLEPKEVVTNFVGYWSSDDYDIAYRLLASDSPLREGLTEEEWEDRRIEWSEVNDPGELLPDFVDERETPRSKLWLPGGRSDSTTKVIEAGWSIELDRTPLDEELEEDVPADEESEELAPGEEPQALVVDEEPAKEPADETLPEVPTASSVYQETGRHWFWATYTLVKDQGEWRIQSMNDEVAQLRNISTMDLLAKIEESNQQIDKLMRKYPNIGKRQLSDKEGVSFLTSLIVGLAHLSYYIDALIERGAAVDIQLVQDVAVMFMTLAMRERALNYMEYVAQHSEERGIELLRTMADARRVLAEQFDEKEYEERAERFREKAEQELKEVLSVEEDADAHISLVELYLDSHRLDEAEEHLLLAKSMTSDPADQAHIELHLGQIAEERELFEEAVGHYQRVADFQPNLASSWINLAKAYAGLNNLQTAENHFRHAIELDPSNIDSYYDMSDMFEKSGQPERAVEILEEGLDKNPDSVDLTLSLATQYVQREDYDQAEIFVERLAQLDPDYEALPLLRQVLSYLRMAPKAVSGKASLPKLELPKLLGQPKKRH